MGYFADPFMSYFVRKVQRRSPLINRGEIGMRAIYMGRTCNIEG